MRHPAPLVLAMAAGLLTAGVATTYGTGPRPDRLLARGAKHAEPAAHQLTPRYAETVASAAVSAPTPADPSAVRLVNAPILGGVSGTLPGTTVYRNEADPLPGFYPPGPVRCNGGTRNCTDCTGQPASFCTNGGGTCSRQRMADDLEIAGGGCDMVYYNLLVYGDDPADPCPAPGTYDVHTELWTNDPCEAGATVIPGTARDFTSITLCDTHLLEADLSGAPVTIPSTVWLAASFSNDFGGWVLAGRAETGFSADFFSELNLERNAVNQCPADRCNLFYFGGNPYAGFWANIQCNVTTPPTGACCDGTSCTEVTEAQCTTGTWQGAFSTCDPSPCLPGACCSGFEFGACADTVESDCVDPDELFHPQATCAQNVCQPTFKAFENQFDTAQFLSIDAGETWADDVSLTRGSICDLEAYSIDVVNDFQTGPFDAQVQLWTNDDRGTPDDETDDIPLNPIAGTQRAFNGLPGNLTISTLVAGPFDGIVLPSKVWLVLSTSSVDAGPMLAGEPSIGFSLDRFAIFNEPSSPNMWANDFFFGGFEPTGCPGPPPPTGTCVPAGSFRINLWCLGDPPTGACCHDGAGTCVDGTLETQCDGRWEPNVTCAEQPFFPPCGAGACCSLFAGDCQDLTETDCTNIEGDFARGIFCEDLGFVCPRPVCLTATGDCLTAHNPDPGCADAYCCEKVCALDAPCCDSNLGGWDQACVNSAATQCGGTALANDHCADATPISGEGLFPFDNSTATTDGPPHDSCVFAGRDEQIANDVWFRWTSPCTAEIFLRTCGLTDLDTKIAVYPGATSCPPSDASKLVCDDDLCPLQSMVTFPAVADGEYLLRIGTFPGGGGFPESPGGVGQFAISCGPPNNAACPGTGSCCVAASPPTPGCDSEPCCEAVCACDPFCCGADGGFWDAACAAMGDGDTGCGAAGLCAELCPTCPSGAVSFIDPPHGVVDAREPNPVDSTVPAEGISAFVVAAPPGADLIGCWELCETQSDGTANGITGVTDNGDGTFTVQLSRPITKGAVTTLTYAAAGTTGRFTFHPGNVSGDAFTNIADVAALVDFLSGTFNPPWGSSSTDINRSGLTTSADVEWLIDVINGGNAFTPGWNATPLPSPDACLPGQ